MSAIDDYLVARTAFIDHDALVEEIVAGLDEATVDLLPDWRRVRFTNTRAAGVATGPAARTLDARTWPLGQASAEALDTVLRIWHRLLFAMQGSWERLSETERLRVEAPPEEADEGEG